MLNCWMTKTITQMKKTDLIHKLKQLEGISDDEGACPPVPSCKAAAGILYWPGKGDTPTAGTGVC